MTEKELYDVLTAPRRTKRRIEVTKARMEKLRVMMLPGAIRYDKDHVQSSPQDPMLVFAEKMDELNTKAVELEGLYITQCNEVEALLKALDDDDRHKSIYKDILELTYLAECRPVEIADKLNYAESTVYKLKREAIKTLIKG